MGRDITWTGEVIGTAGGGLVNATWAANDAVAKVGRDGEIRTAEVLDRLARDRGFTVMHDLAIPIPGFTANIDHAVIAGTTVLLIDTKVWKPGRYWTAFGSTRRGWSRFEHANTKTPRMAHETIGRFLSGRGVTANLLTPLVAVWPSSKRGSLSVRWLKMDGCSPILAARLARRVRRSLPRRPADPKIVAALRSLVNGQDECSQQTFRTARVRETDQSPQRQNEVPPVRAAMPQDDPFAPVAGITLSASPSPTPDDSWDD